MKTSHRLLVLSGILLVCLLAAAVYRLRPEQPSGSPVTTSGGQPAPAVETPETVISPAEPAPPAGGTAVAASPAAEPAVQAPAVAEVLLNPDGTMRSPSDILLEKAVTLATQETAPDATGRFTRHRLVKAEFKYPLLQVEETFQRDPATGEETLVHRQELVADHIMVMLRENATGQDLAALNAKYGGQIRRKMHTDRLYLVEFPNATLGTARQAAGNYGQEQLVVEQTGVDYVAHALQAIPTDTFFTNLWGMHNTGQTVNGTTGTADADIDAPEAWGIFTGSTDLVVGIIDTGIDYNHQDLAANMWNNPGEIAGNGIDDDDNGFVDDVYGWNFINETADPYDDHFHGTHCAGTIGGVGNNSIGVAGVCWRVKMAALKFLNATGSGYNSDAIEAINYATKMRFKLTSNSWGGGSYDAIMAAAIGTAAESNILFVAAAGNAAANNDTTPHYPSGHTNDNVIAVAATDNNDQLASFSCYGLTTVDLGAPGVSIYSCKQSNTYQFLNGTSMATPHVAGAAALAWAYKPDAAYNEIRNYILNNVDSTAALSGKCVTGGRLNIYKMLQQIDRAVIITPYTDVLFSGPDAGPFTPASHTFTVQNVGSDTLSWTLSKTGGNWMDLSATNGTLNPGQSNSVMVTLNASADTLVLSNYVATLTFSNSYNGVKSTRQVILQVFDSLSVMPGTGLNTTGPDGGPFSPSSLVYVISNRAATARSWTGRVTANWIQLSVTNGTLDPGAKQSVTLSLNANASALAVATHTASAVFSNHTSGVLHSRPVSNIVYESFFITPTNGLISYGPNGGPFIPGSIVYTLSNRASSARTWTGLASANWFGLSATGGTVAAGAVTNVTLMITTNADTMADGDYTGTLTFSNTTTGVRQTRSTMLRLNMDDFTEDFFYNYFDLDYKQLIFHPTSEPKGYTLHRATALEFPVATNDHTILNQIEAESALCTLTGGKKIKLYGTSYSSFYLYPGYGFITFEPDPFIGSWDPINHFRMKRISFFYRNLYPENGGTVCWKQLTDRVVVTFTDVAYRSSSVKQNVQVELFFDGTIRFTYLNVDLGNAIVGLSNGQGSNLALPPGWKSSDLSAYPLCPDVFSVDITKPLENTYSWMLPTILVQNKDNPVTADAATPPGSTLTGVDFLANGSLIGTDTAAPYGVVWSNSPPGSNVALTAVAHNSLGQAVTSSPVHVTVTIPVLLWWGHLFDDWEVRETDYTDRPGDQWVGDAYHYMNGALVEFQPWSLLARSNVLIQAAGVEPYAVHINNTTACPFTFRGGDIAGTGYVYKAGAGLAVFTNYTGSLSFSGGTLVESGTVRFVSLAAGGASNTRVQSFGSGPVFLDGGTFSFAGDALFDGQTNVLDNVFVVQPRGGKLTFGRNLTYSPKIVFSGDFYLDTDAVLKLDTIGSNASGLDSLGHELAGTLILYGTNGLYRTGSAGGGTYLTISGNIVDDEAPACLVISNGITSTSSGRHMKITGTDNTYAGGTIIRNDNLANNFTTFAGAVEVASNSRLGTGNVTVDAGGLLKLTGNDNINPGATLELKTGSVPAGTVWIASGVTNVVTTLVLGSDTYTQGVFSSNNAPNFIAGGGAIRLADVTPRIVVSPATVNIPEGSTNGFGVKWSLPLPASVTVSVVRASGDTDITVSPDSLVFTPGDWGVYQYVTLSAAEDDDWLPGSAVIRCSAPDAADADVTAVEGDNDTDPAYLLPWTETFENDGTNAGTLGSLNGQHGWAASGVSVTDSQAQGGTQSAQLTAGQMRHTFSNGTDEVWITFWAQPVSGGTNSAISANASAVFYVNTNGHIVAYSNDSAQVSGIRCQEGGWNRFDVYCNYTSKVWKLKVNGTNVFDNFGFYSLSRSAFGALGIVSEAVSNAFVDTIAVTSDLSDPSDTDSDGLPDDWEKDHFGGLGANPDDLAANGVNTVRECYIAGLNPTNPASVFLMSDLRSLTSANVFQWQGVSGRVYIVYWTSNLLSGFQSLESNVLWTGTIFTDAVHGANNEGFYKIEVQLAP